MGNLLMRRREILQCPTPTKVLWQYTDGDNGLITINTRGGGTGFFSSDGLHLAGSSGTAWSYVTAKISLPFYMDGKSAKIKTTYSGLSVPQWGSASFYYGIESGVTNNPVRLYVQDNRKYSAFVKADGSSVKTTSVVGTFATSGSVTIEYDASQSAYKIYRNDVLKTTISGTLPSSLNGTFAAVQQGSDSGTYSIVITSVLVELL